MRRVERGTVDDCARTAIPVVGIGASAGGLAAFEAFFSGIPVDVDPGMAFVLVQHLAPDHESILADLIQRCTRLEVSEVQDGMRVRANCAYIIPPNHDMAFKGGLLQLMAPIAPRGRRMPIDFFFRSLALDQRELAIGIVLSGTGNDGTLGARAIKGAGGMVMAQTPGSARHDGMPRSALSTGVVDFELPPAEMPAKLVRYVTQTFGRPPKPMTLDSNPDNALNKLMILLHAQCGHDFSLYKLSTVQRRVERRMAVHQVESMEAYVKLAQEAPAELDALFRDLLIGVTGFFRDPDAFAALEQQVVPKLFDSAHPSRPIRLWTPGCSTGEETYSITMLLAERREASSRRVNVQVFATDIDSQAIAAARAGVYPASIAADVSSERLMRHFSGPHDSGYCVNKTIRDMVVFSEQDVARDPPFSRLDLISCRNLLIYLGPELQEKLVAIFHYALNPGGFLFLGSSETVGEYGTLFSVVDRTRKLYQRVDGARDAHRISRPRAITPAKDANAVVSPVHAPAVRAVSPRACTERALLEHATPVGVLINGKGDILYIHGRSGLFLEPAPGDSGVSNIFKMAREGLGRDLFTAVRKAAAGMSSVRCPDLRVKSNGDTTWVNLSVRSIYGEPVPLYLVVLEPGFEPSPAPARQAVARADAVEGETEPVDARIAELQRKLQSQEAYLQSTTEALQTSNEELNSANEELKSVNEELQSANEELETSKEELQSVNEELATVNAELQSKVTELSRNNNDMNNLLAGTGIGTVFVDHGLRVLRFTPAATRHINLIESDVGRPLGHIVSNLTGYDDLVADAKSVLDTLIPKEIEVQTDDGTWQAMRIQPYRTTNNVIEGAVISFVDITDRKRIEGSAREARAFVEEFLTAVATPLVLLDRELRVVAASESFRRAFQCADGEEVLGPRTVGDRKPAMGRWRCAGESAPSVFRTSERAPLPARQRRDLPSLARPLHEFRRDGASVAASRRPTCLNDVAAKPADRGRR